MGYKQEEGTSCCVRLETRERPSPVACLLCHLRQSTCFFSVSISSSVKWGDDNSFWSCFENEIKLCMENRAWSIVSIPWILAVILTITKYGTTLHVCTVHIKTPTSKVWKTNKTRRDVLNSQTKIWQSPFLPGLWQVNQDMEKNVWILASVFGTFYSILH